MPDLVVFKLKSSFSLPNPSIDPPRSNAVDLPKRLGPLSTNATDPRFSSESNALAKTAHTTNTKVDEYCKSGASRDVKSYGSPLRFRRDEISLLVVSGGIRRCLVADLPRTWS